MTTTHYLLRKALGRQAAAAHIESLLALFEIAPVDCAVLEKAVTSDFDDFEDAVLHESARCAGVDLLVTRNVADFKKAQIPVLSPHEFVNVLRSTKDASAE